MATDPRDEASSSPSTRWLWAGLLSLAALLLVAIGFVLRLNGTAEAWDLDEADYLEAASYGLWANALDSEVETPEGQNDVNRLRHRHPPGLQYIMLFWGSLVGQHEQKMRIFSVLAGAATLLLLFLAGWAVRAFRGVMGPLAAAVLATMPFHVEACKIINMHAVSVLLLIGIVVMLARALETRRTRDLYIVAVLVALQSLMMEYGIISGLTVVFCLLFSKNPWLQIVRRSAGERPSVFGRWIQASKGFWRAIGLLFLIYFALWPAGLFRGNSILNFGYYAIEYARAGHPALVDGETVFQVPGSLWFQWFWDYAPAFSVAFALSVGLLLVRPSWGWRPLGQRVVFIFCGVFLVVLFRQHTVLVRYSAHAVALMSLVIGWGLASIYRRFPRFGAATAIVCVVACGITGAERALSAKPGGLGYHEAVAVLEREFEPEARGLVHYGSVLRRYVKDHRIELAPIGPIEGDQLARLRAHVYDYVLFHRHIVQRFPEDPGYLFVKKRGSGYEQMPVIRASGGEPIIWIYRRRDRRVVTVRPSEEALDGEQHEETPNGDQ